MKPMMIRNFIAVILAGLLPLACTSQMIAPKPRLGSPAHHVENGFKLLEMEKIDAAFQEFKMAQELDPGYAAAYLGMGLAYGFREEYEKGLGSLETARLKATIPAQHIEALTGFMRLYTIGNTRMKSNWLQEVEQAFEKTQTLDREAPGPHFFMGMAYKKAGRYDAAETEFIRVFEIGKGFVEAADREYATIQKLKKSAFQ